MTDEIAFQDPTESEAFPGLLFGLLHDRDRVTLACFDTTTETNYKLISLDRRGYLARHALPGTFTAVPPTDSHMIPIHSGDGDRPARRPPPTPALTTHRATHLAFRVANNDFDGLSLLVMANGAWREIAMIDSFGQFIPAYLGPSAGRYLRECGFYLMPDTNHLITLPYNSPQFNRRPNQPLLAAGAAAEDDDPEDDDDHDDHEDDDQDPEDDTIPPIPVPADPAPITGEIDATALHYWNPNSQARTITIADIIAAPAHESDPER